MPFILNGYNCLKYFPGELRENGFQVSQMPLTSVIAMHSNANQNKISKILMTYQTELWPMRCHTDTI